MPTLGPFFKWLRPNHWKHVAIEPKALRDNQYRDSEAFERAWPRPDQTISDDTLPGDSAVRPETAEGKDRQYSYNLQEQQVRDLSPREVGGTWRKVDASGRNGKGGLKDDEIELQVREVGRGSRSS